MIKRVSVSDTLIYTKGYVKMEQSKASLKMKKMILAGGEFDENTYECDVLKYDNKEECIYLVLLEDEIDKISLDGIYRCIICRDGMGMECEGHIAERYTNHEGNVLKFQVTKGFYKINIKSVDKEEV